MRQIAYLIVLLLFLPTFTAAENRPDSVFYRNTGASIEFRILLEDQEKIPWIMMWDREGAPQRVSKEIVIATDDIAGFTIDDYKSDFDDDHGIIMHFEPNSWRKIRETTGRLKGKRVAFVRDGLILLSPIIYSALTRYAGTHLGSTETSVEEFLEDFPTENFPERLRSEALYEEFLLDWIKSYPDDLEIKNGFASLISPKIYEQFVLNWLKNHPDDLEIKNSLAFSSSPKIYEQFLVNWTDRHPEDLGTLRELVEHYFKDKNNPKFKKALVHIQRLVKEKPEDSQMQIRLMQCYGFLGSYEKALATGMQAIPHAPKMEKMFLHRFVGNIQYEMGDKKEAVKSLETSLGIMRQIKIPNIDDIDRTFLSEKSIQELDELVAPKKEEMIQELIDQINYVLSH